MHKCPPAEACRDAFERMSKATVQMCLSTTGFGSQVDMSRVAAGAQVPGSFNSGRRQPLDHRQRPGQPHARRTTQNRPQRPVPKFDMNLADLFSDNPLAERPHPDSRPNAHPYQVRPDQTDPIAPGFAPEDPTRPYGQRTPSMEYFMKYENPASPQQPIPQFYYPTSPQQSGGSPGSTANRPGPVAPADSEGQHGISLDFLDFTSGDQENQAMDADPNADYNMASMPNLGQNVGIDLGFGMAMDFQHDWSENPSYDLLEGYFFGGSGAGAPGGDA